MQVTHTTLDCMPHICSLQVAQEAWGKVCCPNTAQRSQPPSTDHALPSSSAFLLTHLWLSPQQDSWQSCGDLKGALCSKVPESLAGIHALGRGMPSLYHLAGGQTPHCRASFPRFLRLAPPLGAWLWLLSSNLGECPGPRTTTTRLSLLRTTHHPAHHTAYLLAPDLCRTLPTFGLLTSTVYA